jgi:putative copper export protein
MSVLVFNLISLLALYVHIVCATILVGGTLFYEMVVPQAIEDLRNEHQLEVMGRARWVFRWIVWPAVGGILLSGMVLAVANWDSYIRADVQVLTVTSATTQEFTAEPRPASQRPGWWWAAHASTGMMALIIAIFLTTGRRPPESPVAWMRFNLVILLIVMFLATATRHVRAIAERPPGALQPLVMPVQLLPPPATMPNDNE